MKHSGCNNKEALWVASFLIWKKQDFSLGCDFAAPWGCCKVRLRRRSRPRGDTASSGGRDDKPVNSLAFRFLLWLRIYHGRKYDFPMAKSDTGRATVPNGLRKRFDHARTTPSTEAMRWSQSANEIARPSGTCSCGMSTLLSENQLSLVVHGEWWSEETI